MAYELIVTEKPSSAQKLAQALSDGRPSKKEVSKVPYYEIKRDGKEILVASAAGHLFAVAEKEKSFKYPSFDLEWKPAGDVSKGAVFSKKYLTLLKKLVKNADTITVATDYDIEGEVIGLNIVRHIAKKEDARRMKFSTLTKEDLVEAYNNAAKTLNWGQANAGETRHFLDWMYGINLSRALMTAIKEAGSFKILSIGRVQGPALKIITDKEKEIAAFVPEPYWQIKLQAKKDENQIEAWHTEDKFWNKDKAESAFNNVKDVNNGLVTSLEKNDFKQTPPNPFDLGSLQSEAYRLFKLNPKRTLEAAQNLYSSGYISYPRTSSQKLPAKLGFQKILGQLAQNPTYKELANRLLGKEKLTPNEGKKSDPAHPAIYPTGTVPKKLEGPDEKVYDLIVKRFFATFCEEATRQTVKINLVVNGEDFAASGKRTIVRGWHEFYYPYVKLEEVELPEMHEGEELEIFDPEFLEKQTEPPRRYTPASIIKELEKRNLGTKATRADIIDSLGRRGYVKDNTLEATQLGMRTVTTLEKHSPKILDEELTRHFEIEMEKIREKKLEKDVVLKESREVLTKLLSNFDEHQKQIGEELKQAHIETRDEASYLGPCPGCGGKLVIKQAKKSRKLFAACDKYPDCETTFPLPPGALIKGVDKQCEACNNPMIKVIKGKRRPQEVCISPNCPTKQIDESKLEKKQCPKCSADMIVRKSVYGSFYGCSTYPKCRGIEKIKQE